MTKFRVFWGILVVFLVFSAEINATKPVVEGKVWPRNYKLDYPKQDKWMHYPITRHRIFHELGLSEAQLEEIHSLRYKHREELRILRKEQKESIINVLSPDQKDTLDKRLEEIKRFSGKSNSHRPDRNDHNDFPDRRIWERNGNSESSGTNVGLSTWGKIKNLFE
jgi:Spy/CpxP family protein refolding chaperone